ncbi:MAG: response regulator [Burkholderiaceae bacterium]
MSSPEVRLLLVDDDPAAIMVMSRMLAQYPDQRFASSGEAAMKMARESTPDLILLDIEMPGMSGFDVCDALRADAALAGVPVIFSSSHCSPTQQAKALQKSGAGLVAKPLVAATLTAGVRARLQAGKGVDDLRRGRSEAFADPMPAPASDPALNPTARLLIVDDDFASIHLLRRSLAALGELHFAKSGEEALGLAHQLRPDLILLDAHMPGIDGFDVCRSLKSEPAFRHVPIVFITRFSDPRYETRALDIGAADFIAKPFTEAVLQARVRNLLAAKRSTDAELRAALRDAGEHGHERLATETGLRVAAEAECRAKALAMCCVAHEMGGPLTGLLCQSELLAGDTHEPLSAAQFARLGQISQSGQQLQALMGDLLDLGRAGMGALAMSPRPLDAGECIERACAAVAAQARQAGVALLPVRPGPVLTLRADARRLQQCLVNLLTNAVKYTPGGGWVQLGAQGDSPGFAAIDVRDGGPGLDPLQRQHLFEPFNRLGREQGDVPGEGLGLLITRQLVRAMGGELRVDSAPGRGSCFTLLLPLAGGAGAAAP